MGDRVRYQSILDDVVYAPDLVSQKDAAGNIIKTFCNVAVQRALKEYCGYSKFDGMLANEIYDYIQSASEWYEMEAGDIQTRANNGIPGVAVHRYVNHGHICMIAPGEMSYSGHWGIMCPLVANVGAEKNGYVGANLAFKVTETPPKYYLFVQGNQA